MRAAHATLGIALAALAAGTVPYARADEPVFRAEVNATRVGVEDQVQLTLTLEGASVDAGTAIVPPTLRNLRVAGGPMVSTQVSFVNGAVSQSRVITYVLQPIGEGRAEIGPARVKLPSRACRTPGEGIVQL